MGLRSCDCYACDALIIKTVYLTWDSSSIYERDERKICIKKKKRPTTKMPPLSAARAAFSASSALSKRRKKIQ